MVLSFKTFSIVDTLLAVAAPGFDGGTGPFCFNLLINKLTSSISRSLDLFDFRTIASVYRIM
ncbi:hypothetical protein D3C71_1805520 [compost metagenome]